MDPKLLELLCCPNCQKPLSDNREYLSCSSCAREYRIRDGIPDLRVYQSKAQSDAFNEEQARYEANLHDEEAESGYEKSVIRIFGTKTKLMAQSWAMELDNTSHIQVLDYGCGTGQLSRVMAHYVKPLFAFDISEKSLYRNVEDNAVVGVLANSLHLPFKDRAFDAICCNGVLHHIVDLERAVSELARIARSRIYVSEGMPKTRPFFSMIPSYPGLSRKGVYALYVCAWWLQRCALKGKRALSKICGKSRPPRPPHGSKYEKPLDMDVVERLLSANGFRRKTLRYYTNINIPGDGLLKRTATRVLCNQSIGTHFDLRMERVDEKE